MRHIRKIFVRTFMANSFNRDVVMLVIISVAIGAFLASLVSMAANSYFSETISTLVGDYGEFDVIINVREEMKEEGRAQIEKILAQVYPGAKLKEGPTLTGLTSFFIGFPTEYKTKQTYEALNNSFGSVPGRSGISIMTEPRVTVKGVPEGAKSSIIDQIMQIEGVLFAFRDGGSVTVIVSALDKSAFVNAEIEKLLKQYQLIEIAFPVGSEPDNPIRLGKQIAEGIRADKAVGYAESVSADSKNNEMVSMVSTMLELKRFLSSYTTQVTITPAAGVKFTPGDVIAFQGAAPNEPIAANVPAPDNVLVQLTEVGGDGLAKGMIMQGDGAQISNYKGYMVINNTVGAQAGTASVHNPRQQLGNALMETSKLVGQIPGFAQDAQQMTTIAGSALNNYGSSLAAIEQTLVSLESAGATIQAATSGLANINTSGIQTQLDNSSRALGGLVGTFQVIKVINPDITTSINDLKNTQQNIENLRAGLSELDNVAANARQARSAIDNIVANGHNTITTLRAFDVDGARKTLNSASTHLAQVQQFNTPLIAAQLQVLGTAIPNLRDDEISRTVQLLDKVIAGQVTPSQRIQILTHGNISTELVAPIIYREVGHNNLSLYKSELGIIEPDPRAEVMTILTQVKAILAGMIALIASILFLVLDHTAIMSVIRRNRSANKVQAQGWRRFVQGIRNTLTAPECLYGMAIGAMLLTAMFILAGGGIPYLPWIGVPFLGALFGLLVANNAEKISPVSIDEVTAGEALGLSFDEIMREIVIPNGRPGLLQKLNRRKMKFK
ncbi:hypothetical protein [Sporomusa sp.]|uniref:hypothetical protein n=1 Tax=Sporomusa sp. TaxID=2078658 RepID=UPI002CBDBA2B|nr:hypothetical protein [Sporomusa sp.]HWR42614.1 hypothetical protein [Sporomusa sp.]